jgi:hypothetical protein
MKYELHIGEAMFISSEGMGKKPLQIIQITEEQKVIIDSFADMRYDKDLNKIYKINEIEFKMYPKLTV